MDVQKNSIEFFVGLDFYLYYFYNGCTISLWSHVLPECSVITWPCHVTLVPILFISQPHYTSWGFGLSVQIYRKLFPFWGSHNTSPFLLFSLSSSMLTGTDYTICFLLVFREEIFVLGFHKFGPSCLYIPYSLHTLLLLLPSTILSQAEVHLLEVCSSPHNIPVLFPIWNIPASSLAVSFVVWPHVLPLLFFFSLSLLQCLDTSIYSALSSNTKNTSLFPLFFPAFIPWPLLLFYTSSLDLLIL